MVKDHMGYTFQLAAKVILYASSHRQDNTYHGLCYTSCGALAGTRNSSMGPPWRINPTTHHTMNEHSYHGATSHSKQNKNNNKTPPTTISELQWEKEPTAVAYCMVQISAISNLALMASTYAESVTVIAPIHKSFQVINIRNKYVKTLHFSVQNGEWRMFYLITHSTHSIYSYATSDIWLSSIHMQGNTLHLLFLISSKGSFICTILQTKLYILKPLLHKLWSTGC